MIYRLSKSTWKHIESSRDKSRKKEEKDHIEYENYGSNGSKAMETVRRYCK